VEHAHNHDSNHTLTQLCADLGEMQFTCSMDVV